MKLSQKSLRPTSRSISCQSKVMYSTNIFIHSSVPIASGAFGLDMIMIFFFSLSGLADLRFVSRITGR